MAVLDQDLLNMNRLTCLVIRDSADELTYAFVAADQAGEIRNAGALRTAIVKAVTEWMQTTSGGKQAWETTNQDFNVGDLSLELSEVSLRALLEKHGVRHLTINVHSCGHSSPWVWTYDDHLFDVAAVEEAFSEKKKNEAS